MKTSDPWDIGFVIAFITAGGGTAALIALKLTGTVPWSWLWIMSPLWILGGAVVLLGTYVFAFSALSTDD